MCSASRLSPRGPRSSIAASQIHDENENRAPNTPSLAYLSAYGDQPCAAYPETWRLDLGGARFVDLNLNPPILLPLFRLFAEFDLVTGARLWAVASALLALATAGLLLRGRTGLQTRQVVWLFAAPALGDTLFLGQIYGLLFLLATLAWLALKQGRLGPAGAAIGLLVLIKPIFCLWPVYLFVAGHRRPAIVAGLVVASLGAACVPVFGIELHRDWLAALAADRHGLIPTDASLQGYFGRLGLPSAGRAAAALLVTLTLAWTWHRARARPLCVFDASGLAVTVALLASPLAWFHYVLVLAPFLMERPWERTATAAALLLAVPVAVPLAVTNGPVWANSVFGGLYVAGLVLMLAAFVGRNGVLSSGARRTIVPDSMGRRREAVPGAGRIWGDFSCAQSNQPRPSRPSAPGARNPVEAQVPSPVSGEGQGEGNAFSV